MLQEPYASPPCATWAHQETPSLLTPSLWHERISQCSWIEARSAQRNDRLAWCKWHAFCSANLCNIFPNFHTYHFLALCLLAEQSNFYGWRPQSHCKPKPKPFKLVYVVAFLQQNSTQAASTVWSFQAGHSRRSAQRNDRVAWCNWYAFCSANLCNISKLVYGVVFLQQNSTQAASTVWPFQAGHSLSFIPAIQ